MQCLSFPTGGFGIIGALAPNLLEGASVVELWRNG